MFVIGRVCFNMAERFYCAGAGFRGWLLIVIVLREKK